MASNSFGQLFRITTFGESHGPALGVVIDGCPSLIPITEKEIDEALALRRPGNTPYTSPRKEKDTVEILSGVFEGKTTGAPITLLIRNQDADNSSYAPIKDLYRPGHANFTYLQKYGIFDYRGGGRSSARETVARVAAGVLAKKILLKFEIECCAFIDALGGIQASSQNLKNLKLLKSKTLESPVFCPDKKASLKMMKAIEQVKEEGDSLGAILACVCHVPEGLGDPVYSKLEALLASAMLSIPASKGFEIGSGFSAASMKGSEHNDPFDVDKKGHVHMSTNHAGGTLGGISTGTPLFFRVAFKPTSSIKKPQKTASLSKKKATFELPPSGRHDPCVAIRAVPIVEAMAALVLVDRLLIAHCGKLCR